MMLNTEEFFTLREFAAFHEVTPRAVYGWLRAKIAPAHVYQFGGYFFCKKAAVEFIPPWKSNGHKTGNKKYDETRPARKRQAIHATPSPEE